MDLWPNAMLAEQALGGRRAERRARLKRMAFGYRRTIKTCACMYELGKFVMADGEGVRE
jgi:hypothetical protein